MWGREPAPSKVIYFLVQTNWALFGNKDTSLNHCHKIHYIVGYGSYFSVGFGSISYMNFFLIFSTQILPLYFRLVSVSSVSDPYSFFTDPDPEDPDGGQYGSGSNPDGSRALMTKN